MGLNHDRLVFPGIGSHRPCTFNHLTKHENFILRLVHVGNRDKQKINCPTVSDGKRIVDYCEKS